MFFRSAPQTAWSILFFLDGGEGEPIGIKCEREQVRRIGPSELRRFGGHGERQQEDGSRRPTTGTNIIIMRAAIVFFFFFYEAVVQHVTYATDFCRVSRRVVYPSWETTRSNFQFSGTGVVAALQPVKKLRKEERSLISVLWFLVPLLLLHCMPAGRHCCGSTPDSRCVRLYSRLPCGSYGARSQTAVVCSRELVSCGDGGTVCCS